jgi:hypothetical protein
MTERIVTVDHNRNPNVLGQNWKAQAKLEQPRVHRSGEHHRTPSNVEEIWTINWDLAYGRNPCTNVTIVRGSRMDS